MADARRTRALARAARESGDDQDDSMLSAASSIMQDNLLRVSLKLKNSSEDDPSDTAKTLSLVSRAFADIGRLDISRQKWQLEMEAKIRVDERSKAAEVATAAANAGGASQETIATIRSALGI